VSIPDEVLAASRGSSQFSTIHGRFVNRKSLTQRGIERPMEKTGWVAPELPIICPDCHTAATAHGCPSCGRVFVEDGVWNLLPSTLSATKVAENSVFVKDAPEWQKINRRPWRALALREVLRFDHLSAMFSEGPWLELGGETCFPSAIMASLHPDWTVVASDISPNSLRGAAMPVCSLFPRQPSLYAAVDAESIPFADETFGSVFALTMMHHLERPVRMLEEVRRVLRPGGRFVAVDHSVPSWWRWVFSGVANERAAEFGVTEKLMSPGTWDQILAEAGMPLSCLRVHTGPQYLRSPSAILGATIVSKLPASLARSLFPTGIVLVYDKPVSSSRSAPCGPHS
jgi:SAM-dependent methyltransferase